MQLLFILPYKKIEELFKFIILVIKFITIKNKILY